MYYLAIYKSEFPIFRPSSLMSKLLQTVKLFTVYNENTLMGLLIINTALCFLLNVIVIIVLLAITRLGEIMTTEFINIM